MINTKNAKHYKWGENCDSWVFHDNKKLSIKLESMPFGTKEVNHRHAIKEQFFFISEGTAVFYLDGKLKKLKKNESVFVPANAIHSIQNKSVKPLVFLVITYPNLENDRLDIS